MTQLEMRRERGWRLPTSVAWSSEELERVDAAAARLGVVRSQIVRDSTLARVDEILEESGAAA